MAGNIQEIFKKKIVSIRFERTLGLLGATTLGIGALMGAGIYVLIGLAAGQTGPSVGLAYLLCGLLTLPSVFMFRELSRKVPVAGGGYAYAYHALGSLGGFVAGWLLALGSIFACAMYAIGFAYYLASSLGPTVPEQSLRQIALILVLALTALNCRGIKGGERAQRFFTWGNLLVLLVLVLLAMPGAETRQLHPLFPKGLSGMGAAIAIIYISFFGYQLIANNAEEIVDAERTIPRAMLISMLVSLAFYVAIALVSVMVVPWEYLAASKAPLVEVASRSIGNFGWLLIAMGGVLASAAALNSTLLSQARQVYAMGKDGFLPSLLGRIHEVRRTPQAALLAGGLLTGLAVLFGELEFIAKAANFCFLTSLLLISLALRSLHRFSSPSGPWAYWKRFLPYAALLTNLALLLTIDLGSTVFGLQLLAVGLAVYVLYSRRKALRSRVGMSVVLLEQRRSVFQRGPRILVPMANPQTQEAIFSISEALLANQKGEIVLLSVVTAPEQTDFYSALSDAGDSLEILDRTTKVDESAEIRLRPVVRVSRSLSQGIVHAAQEEGCSLIVMGYSGDESVHSSTLMEEMLNRASTDLIFVKLKADFSPTRVCVALGGKANLNLMVHLAGVVADRFGGEITFLNILPTNYTVEQKTQTDKLLIEAIQQYAARALYRIEVLSSDSPLDLMVQRSGQSDLLIVGTTKVGVLERAVVGPFATQLVERAKCSVAVVRAISQAKKAVSQLVAE